MDRWLPLLVASSFVMADGRLAVGQPPANSAEAIFQARCAACHSIARAVRPLKAMSDSPRRQHLEKFLGDHHVPDSSERAMLIDYLLKAASR